MAFVQVVPPSVVIFKPEFVAAYTILLSVLWAANSVTAAKAAPVFIKELGSVDCRCSKVWPPSIDL